MKNIILLILILLTTCNSKLTNNSTESVAVNDSIENELLLLKNQAFCDLFRMETSKEKIVFKESTTYIQFSNLDMNYFNDSNLNKIIKKWESKDYKSYNPTNKLILMKCLDFYNSNDLKNYIDSVRVVEYKKNGK
jgi:hypothetical protein